MTATAEVTLPWAMLPPGHTVWVTFSLGFSQPRAVLHPGEAEPRGFRKLQRGRTELLTSQSPAGSSVFCLLLGQGYVCLQENPLETPTYMGSLALSSLPSIPSKL